MMANETTGISSEAHPPDKRLVSVVVPLFNEAWCVAPLWGKFSQLRDTAPYAFEFVLVNDGSTDETGEVLDRLAEEHREVRVIHLRRNFGVTQALMAGFDHATGDVVVTLDGNLQNDPADIPALIEKIDEGYDVCSGWRRDRGQGPLKRSFPNRAINLLISRISEVPLHDHECSLKAYRRETLEGMQLYGDLHRYIPVYAYWRGARVAEVPVEQYPHAHGHGNRENPSTRTLKTALDLILLKFFARYAQRPLYVFGSAGMASMLLSLLAFGLMLYYKFFGEKTFIETPLPLVVVFGLLTGVLLILMGVLAEITVRIYYATRNEPLYVVRELRNL